jgi:hypothetical protein
MTSTLEEPRLLLHEAYLNRTEGHMIGEQRTPFSEVYFKPTAAELYRYGLREYGRCTGKVWVDGDDGPPVHVGYVFEARDRYEDTGETYLREVWLTIEREVEPARGAVVRAEAISGATP